MADYSGFSATLGTWIQAVWKKRAFIKSAADAYAEAKVQQGVQRGDVKARYRRSEFRDVEGSGQVYDLYNDPATVAVGGGVFYRFRQDCEHIASHYGINVFPQGGRWIANEFYHFEPDNYGGIDYRVYAHVNSPYEDHCTDLAIEVGWIMQDAYYSGIQKFKIAGPGFTTERGDGLVIYIQDETTKDRVLEYLGLNATAHFSGQLSPGVKQVRDGLGWAKEPPALTKDHPLKNHPEGAYSFGSYLGALIFVALKDTYFKNMTTKEDAFIQQVLAVFDKGNVDPKNPHKPCASRAELELLKQTAHV